MALARATHSIRQTLLPPPPPVAASTATTCAPKDSRHARRRGGEGQRIRGENVPTDGTLMLRIRGIGIENAQSSAVTIAVGRVLHSDLCKLVHPGCVLIRNAAGTALFQFETGRLDKFQR